MLELLIDPHAWVALLTLTVLEVVLGIDNLVFISILTTRLDAKRSKQARAVGLSLAFVFRIVLLAFLSFLIGLTQPIFEIRGFFFSWRDMILIAGGFFLIAKATHEIHHEVEGQDGEDIDAPKPRKQALAAVIAQLAVIDLVFSIDSIITAIGLVDDLEVMIAAISISMIVMYAASNPVGAFIKAHPTTKMLALSFLVLIGAALFADGFHFHIPRGYIYSAMAFAAAVEVFNVLAGRNRRKRANRR